MRQNSLIIFTTFVVLTLCIVGGTHYLYLQGQKATPDKELLETQPGIGNAQAVNRAVKPAVRRTATPHQVHTSGRIGFLDECQSLRRR